MFVLFEIVPSERKGPKRSKALTGLQSLPLTPPTTSTCFKDFCILEMSQKIIPRKLQGLIYIYIYLWSPGRCGSALFYSFFAGSENRKHEDKQKNSSIDTTLHEITGSAHAQGPTFLESGRLWAFSFFDVW